MKYFYRRTFLGDIQISFLSFKVRKEMINLEDENLKRALSGKVKVILQTPMRGRGTNDFGQYQCLKLKLKVWNDTEKLYQNFTYWNKGTLASPYIEVGKEIRIKIDADNHKIIFASGIPSVQYSLSSEKNNRNK